MGFASRIRRTIKGLFSGSPRRPEHLSTYPNSCLRALKKARWIIEGKCVSADTFLPDTRTADRRDDDCCETSVNWEDDSGAFTYTLEKMGCDSAHGAARLPVSEIDRLRKVAETFCGLSYERSPTKGNQYHGNLLFAAELSTALTRQMAGTLAMYSELLDKKTA